MDIRTPDDEVTTPGYLYPPFKAGRVFEGATYAGHHDFAVDFNRRDPITHAWMPDDGEPVLAAARGRVVSVDHATGFVTIQHRGGFRTEYGHMQPVEVSKGQYVRRGDRIGRIGQAGNAPNGTHLHHAHYQRDPNTREWVRIKMRFLGEPVATSVWNSDTRPKGWEPPAPVYVVGPPRRATWKSAYRAAAKALAALEAAQTPEVPA